MCEVLPPASAKGIHGKAFCCGLDCEFEFGEGFGYLGLRLDDFFGLSASEVLRIACAEKLQPLARRFDRHFDFHHGFLLLLRFGFRFRWNDLVADLDDAISGRLSFRQHGIEDVGQSVVGDSHQRASGAFGGDSAHFAVSAREFCVEI